MSEDPVKLSPSVRFGPYECECHRSSYPHGGAAALYLTEKETGEPIATATVNVPEANIHLLSGEDGGREEFVLIKDYSENSGMLAALEEARIVEDTGKTVPVGFTSANIARLLL